MHHQAASLNELNLHVLRGCVYDPAHQGCFCSYALILLQLCLDFVIFTHPEVEKAFSFRSDYH